MDSRKFTLLSSQTFHGDECIVCTNFEEAVAVLQLNPPLPMNTPKGEGFAHILIDYGPESDLYWTVLITATGEIWTFANRHVRASKNITLGRTDPGTPDASGSAQVPMRPRGIETQERS